MNSINTIKRAGYSLVSVLISVALLQSTVAPVANATDRDDREKSSYSWKKSDNKDSKKSYDKDDDRKKYDNKKDSDHYDRKKKSYSKDKKDNKKHEKDNKHDKHDKKDKKDHKTKVCHATGSKKNPYVKINVGKPSVEKKGHGSQDNDKYDWKNCEIKKDHDHKDHKHDRDCDDDHKKPETPQKPETPEAPAVGGASTEKPRELAKTGASLVANLLAGSGILGATGLVTLKSRKQ